MTINNHSAFYAFKVKYRFTQECAIKYSTQKPMKKALAQENMSREAHPKGFIRYQSKL